jgi:hypothetical protein
MNSGENIPLTMVLLGREIGFTKQEWILCHADLSSFFGVKLECIQIDNLGYDQWSNPS